MNRAEYLHLAEKTICRDRQDVHGNPENTFELIAQYWSTFLSAETNQTVTLCGADVAAMMALFKIARMQVNPFHHDNIVDGLGYLAISGELIGLLTGSDETLNDK